MSIGDRAALVGLESGIDGFAGGASAALWGFQPDGADPRGGHCRPLHRTCLRGEQCLEVDRRGLFVLGSLFAVILMFGYVDTANDKMDLLDAVYFSVETLATVGHGDFAFDAARYLRIVAILVMIMTVALMAILYALVTEFLVGRRLAATFACCV